LVVALQEKERRKVQISGKSSCMVALPKKWVKEMGLRQGSEIVITRPSLASLLITADADAPVGGKQEAVIEVSERDTQDILFRKIVSLYVLGYNQISIRGNNGFLNSGKRDGIKNLVRRHLIGTEGVADSKDKITIHVLLGYSELSVDNALKKMLLITTSMHRDAILALENNDKDLAEGVIQRDDEAGRFGLYVIRQLNVSINQGIYKESILEPRDLLGYTQVARTMERIASHAGRMAKVVKGLERPLSKQLEAKLGSMSGSAAGLVEEALLSLFKRDHAGADLVVEKARRFVEMEDELVQSLDEKDIKTYYTIHLLVDSQKRIAEYARDIAEVVLDLTIERVVRKESAPYLRAPSQTA
jgi:phosphate uptake regulator